jgi:hypothetical protein
VAIDICSNNHPGTDVIRDLRSRGRYVSRMTLRDKSDQINISVAAERPDDHEWYGFYSLLKTLL